MARTGPQAASLPVVIGSGSHPFPFRTRKLSLIPPMVLHGKLCGRVGRCRHYSTGPDRQMTVGPFLCNPPRSSDHTVSHALHGLLSWAALACSVGACGRVGRCRHYSTGPDRQMTVGPFLCNPPRSSDHTV